MLCCILDAVNYQLHGWLRGIHPLLLSYVFFKDVVLIRPTELLGWNSLLFADGNVHGEQDVRRRVDGHRRTDLIQGYSGEEGLHVGEAVNRNTSSPNFAEGTWIIRVECHQRWVVECDR